LAEQGRRPALDIEPRLVAALWEEYQGVVVLGDVKGL
jgi:hypothetical protein